MFAKLDGSDGDDRRSRVRSTNRARSQRAIVDERAQAGRSPRGKTNAIVLGERWTLKRTDGNNPGTYLVVSVVRTAHREHEG